MHPEEERSTGRISSWIPTDLLKLALAPAAATTVIYAPQLLTDSDQMSTLSPSLGLLWVVMLLLAAPVIAFLLRRRGAQMEGRGQEALVGLAQFAVAVILVRLDTWLEVRSGYLLAGSGEEAMSYGIGTTIGAIGGMIIAALVLYGARLGGRHGRAGASGAGGLPGGQGL